MCPLQRFHVTEEFTFRLHWLSIAVVKRDTRMYYESLSSILQILAIIKNLEYHFTDNVHVHCFIFIPDHTSFVVCEEII